MPDKEQEEALYLEDLERSHEWSVHEAMTGPGVEFAGGIRRSGGVASQWKQYILSMMGRGEKMGAQTLLEGGVYRGIEVIPVTGSIEPLKDYRQGGFVIRTKDGILTWEDISLISKLQRLSPRDDGGILGRAMRCWENIFGVYAVPDADGEIRFRIPKGDFDSHLAFEITVDKRKLTVIPIIHVGLRHVLLHWMDRFDAIHRPRTRIVGIVTVEEPKEE